MQPSEYTSLAGETRSGPAINSGARSVTGFESDNSIYETCCMKENVKNDDFFLSNLAQYEVLYYYVYGCDRQIDLIAKIGAEHKGTLIVNFGEYPEQHIKNFNMNMKRYGKTIRTCVVYNTTGPDLVKQFWSNKK